MLIPGVSNVVTIVIATLIGLSLLGRGGRNQKKYGCFLTFVILLISIGASLYVFDYVRINMPNQSSDTVILESLAPAGIGLLILALGRGKKSEKDSAEHSHSSHRPH